MAKAKKNFESFESWIDEVDYIIIKKVGLSYQDLPDYCYRDAYDDGMTPVECANAAIRAAKEY